MTPGDPAFSLEDERDTHVARPRLRVVGPDDVPAPDGPGQRLQLARLEKGLSVVQVATALRLKTRHIAGMEATDFSRLPGLGYALGWVKSYADYLDLPDPAGIVSEFRARWAPVQLAGEVWRPRPKLEIKWPKASLIAAAFGAWLAIWGIWHVVFAPKPVDDVGPPDAAIQRWANAPATTSAANPVVDTSSETIIRAVAPVKVEIRGGDGALAVSRVMQPGDTLSPDGFGRWALAASDGAALQVVANGQTYIPGTAGVPVSNWRTPDPAVAAAASGAASGAASPTASGAVPLPGAVAGAVAAGAVGSAPASPGATVPVPSPNAATAGTASPVMVRPAAANAGTAVTNPVPSVFESAVSAPPKLRVVAARPVAKPKPKAAKPLPPPTAPVADIVAVEPASLQHAELSRPAALTLPKPLKIKPTATPKPVATPPAGEAQPAR